MSLQHLKKELVALIENTDDEQLLSLVKEEFMFYGKTKDADVIDNLIEEQLKELKLLTEEDENKDTMSLEEFKEATKPWRTK